MIKVLPEHLPKLYTNAVEQIRSSSPAMTSYGDYENSEVKFNYQDDYEILTKLGRGRYSEVFKATNLLTNKDVVVKILKPGKFKIFNHASTII